MITYKASMDTGNDHLGVPQGHVFVVEFLP